MIFKKSIFSKKLVISEKLLISKKLFEPDVIQSIISTNTNAKAESPGAQSSWFQTLGPIGAQNTDFHSILLVMILTCFRGSEGSRGVQNSVQTHGHMLDCIDCTEHQWNL